MFVSEYTKVAAGFCCVFTLLHPTIGQQSPLLIESERGGPHVSQTHQQSELLRLHRHLIEIPSVTGDEGNIGEWLSDYLEEQGLTVERQYLAHNRFNIFAYPAKSAIAKILVSSHIDTVPPFIPYSLRENTEIWGRGSVDAKACVAAQILAVLGILNSSPGNATAPLALLFVVGEEKGGDGMRHFSAHNPTNYTAVVFGEPTENKLASGHKGMLSFSIEVKGRAAHSGYPWRGISATDILIEALGVLRTLEQRLPSSRILGNSTLNIGRIEGGVAGNVVAEHALAEVSIRIAAGSPQAITSVIDEGLSSIKKSVEARGGNLSTIFRDGAYGPVHLDTDVEGFDVISVNYGTDVPNLKGDHRKYLYGPGSILVAHGPNEHLTVHDMNNAVDAYAKLIQQLLEK